MEPPAGKKARLHFGSLEDQERVRLQTGGGAFSSAVREGILSGNINISSPSGGGCVGWGDIHRERTTSVSYCPCNKNPRV